MTEERAARQRELLAPYIAAADALITTAAVPGRRAPVLVTSEMVAQMKPGSVVVDLAAESGGNVEGAEPGAVVRVGGVQLWGGANVPSQMPAPASRLYAQNVLNVIMLMTREGAFAPDFDDEIVAAMCLTHDGELRNDALLCPELVEGQSSTSSDRIKGAAVNEAIIWLTIFVLAVFVGIEVISKVSATLHTPLMSGANAIHGVILIGAILVAGTADSTPILVLSLVAVVLATINMVGGFVVTDRMLIMFRPRRSASKELEP